MSELHAGVTRFVVHAEALRDADGCVVARIDDRDDAAASEGFEHVMHGGGAAFRCVAAAPHIACEPPADLQIAGRAERLRAADADQAIRRFLNQRADADAELLDLPLLAA